MKTNKKNKGSFGKELGKEGKGENQRSPGLKNKVQGNQLTKDEPEQDSAKQRVHEQQKDKRQNSGKEIKREPSSQGLKVDETLRHDIQQTDVNPNTPRRKPTIEGAETEAEKQLNKNERAINEQEDAVKHDKYQGL
jgi:hypothetical protein